MGLGGFWWLVWVLWGLYNMVFWVWCAVSNFWVVGLGGVVGSCGGFG